MLELFRWPNKNNLTFNIKQLNQINLDYSHKHNMKFWHKVLISKKKLNMVKYKIRSSKELN